MRNGHIKRELIGKIPFAANTTAKLNIPIDFYYKRFWVEFQGKVVFGAGGNPVAPVSAGLLGVINRVRIMINNSERLMPWDISGHGLAEQHNTDNGVYPWDYGPLSSVFDNKVYRSKLSMHFGLPGLRERYLTALDLTNEEANPGLFTAAEFIVDFAGIDELFLTANGATIEDCELCVYAERVDKQSLPVDDNARRVRAPLRYVREEKAQIFNNADFSHYLKKTPGVDYLGASLMARFAWQGQPKSETHINMKGTEKITVKMGSETLVDAWPVDILNHMPELSRRCEYKQDHIRVDLTNQGNAFTGMLYSEMTQDVEVRVPVSFEVENNKNYFFKTIVESVREWDFS